MESEKGQPLPKFGEWDVNNPASAEGFTMIFNKARDEKKTGTGTPSTPTRKDVGGLQADDTYQYSRKSLGVFDICNGLYLLEEFYSGSTVSIVVGTIAPPNCTRSAANQYDRGILGSISSVPIVCPQFDVSTLSNLKTGAGNEEGQKPSNVFPSWGEVVYPPLIGSGCTLSQQFVNHLCPCQIFFGRTDKLTTWHAWGPLLSLCPHRHPPLKPRSREASDEAALEAEEKKLEAEEGAPTDDVTVGESVSFKEESNVVEDLVNPKKKARDELKQLIQATLANNEFAPPPPPLPRPAFFFYCFHRIMQLIWQVYNANGCRSETSCTTLAYSLQALPSASLVCGR
ncbi:hypothetical protein Cni_G03473 [Canna indica]|uniref:RIN4 pathogenic type III effector avirulence factor Avr cleavage site domain-containing protein n=1 Tax=Canna indica TaxID=4628 RepID=A0AAQ3JSI6_9LILI|nr:hypothetical protein Cni_G03473 [Canna indica]